VYTKMSRQPLLNLVISTLNQAGIHQVLIQMFILNNKT